MNKMNMMNVNGGTDYTVHLDTIAMVPESQQNQAKSHPGYPARDMTNTPVSPSWMSQGQAPIELPGRVKNQPWMGLKMAENRRCCPTVSVEPRISPGQSSSPWMSLE